MPTSSFGALKILDPEEWSRRIRQAMKDSNGIVTGKNGAAAKLGIHQRWLFTMLDDPDNGFGDLVRAKPGNPKLVAAGGKAKKKAG